MRTIAILTLLGTRMVFAQGSLTPDQLMSQNDRNGDGVITKEEANAAGTPLARVFDQIDTNGDGRITRDELRAIERR
jgi:Ca2+-binding EF-hand superfamily protein